MPANSHAVKSRRSLDAQSDGGMWYPDGEYARMAL
jgi:hypothetical protein